jgi:CheY-like chemotaxis protein
MDRPLQIFLIDDDTDDQEIFTWIISTVDASSVVQTASDGVDALDKLKASQYQPDIIFLDLNMPRMHGLDCLRHLRQISVLDSTPVIVYSTSSYVRDIDESRKAGATDYIVKANETSVIKQELTEALKKYDPR